VVVDVTDVLEFWTRRESPSGVQRVIIESMPALARQGAVAIALDRARGVFVLLTADEQRELFTERLTLDTESGREQLAVASSRVLDRCTGADPFEPQAETVALFLGAAWINDALMLAARDLHARGARCVYLLYDLTPVLEAGHTSEVRRLFEAYLRLLVDTASRVPAISHASRSDFEAWCRDGNARAPGGRGIGLPMGLDPTDFAEAPDPWPRPYALMVGTIEARKNHLLALEVWRELIDRHGHASVPDLVCIGRLGWHSEDFLTGYRDTRGLDGKVSLLSGGVSDEQLGAFYRHARFTLYPSRYEGWGLPVSEALAFGKVTIAADNSSLREAGGDRAIYVRTDDRSELLEAIEAWGLNETALRAKEEEIAAADSFPKADAPTWHDVADALLAECREAREVQVPVTMSTLQMGREYTFAAPQQPPSADYADQYADHLMYSDVSPLLAQPHPEPVPAGVLLGQLGSPQTWGLELHPGRRFEVRLTRPIAGDLVALIATRSQPGIVKIEASGPGGPIFTEVHLGSVLTLPLGTGEAGESALVTFRVTDAADTVEGFVGVRSLVILEASDLTTRLAAAEAAARALRQELDFIHGTRSWRVTAPLRRWKGRGA